MTLDDDLAAELQRLARERGISFKEVLNGSIRRGLGTVERGTPYQVPSRPLGLRRGVDLTRASELAAEDEDAETLRKLALRK